MKMLNVFMARGQTLLLSTVMSAVMLTMLSACGGGNGPAGAPMGSGGEDVKGTITLQLTNESGQEVSVIPAGTVALVTANVVDAFGDAVPNILVAFTISKNPTAGSISPADGFAATDSSGKARVTLIPGISGQSGEVKATASIIEDSQITGTIAFRAQ